MASLPPETGVGRVCLVVADRERVLSFYRDVLGLDVVADGEPTLLGAGGEVLV